MRRSRMVEEIVGLLVEGAITLDELEDFSGDLKEMVRIWTGGRFE